MDVHFSFNQFKFFLLRENQSLPFLIRLEYKLSKNTYIESIYIDRKFVFRVQIHNIRLFL